MSPTIARRVLLMAGLGLLSACESPSAPRYELAALRRAPTADVCDPVVNPICTAFQTFTYAYDPAVAPLPPGISDWVLKITQNGGSLEFLGAVTHGGTAITSVSNMFVRFYIDNGNGVLGSGDLQVVLRADSGSAEIHCGIVTTVPTGSVLAPTSSPALCENTGYSTDDNGRFFFDGYRTADLSEPLWVAEGFQPLEANSTRDIWLFQVGNVDQTLATPLLLPATAPVSPVPYILPTIAGPPIVPDDTADGDPDPTGDVTAPTIVFSGNAGTYTVDQDVDIDCVASDAGSGIATATCPSAQGPAYAFGVGQETLQASATDVAGNTATAQTSFEVTVTPDGLCTLANRFAKNYGIGTALCAQIAAVVKRSERDGHDRGRVTTSVADVVETFVTAQRGTGFTLAHADLLLQLVGRL